MAAFSYVKHWLVIIVALLLFTMLVAGSVLAEEEVPFFSAASQYHKAPFTIGVSNGYIGNNWRAQFVEDIKDVANRLKAQGDVKDVIIVNATSGVSDQIAQINSLINRGVDALVINPVSAEALKPVLLRAMAQRILVVIADDPLPLPGVLNVVLNQYQYWQIETEWLAKQLKGKGNIVSIEGLAGNSANEWRVRGRNDVLKKYPQVKLLASVPGGWDQAQARTVMTSLLSAHSDIDGVLAQDVESEGIIRAFQSVGRDLPPMTGDYVHSFLKLWNSLPNLQTMAVVNPPAIGADALWVAAELLRGRKLKASSLVENPFSSSGVRDTILIPEPYVIERKANPTATWITPGTESISLAQALAMLAGKPDGAAVDKVMSEEEILSMYFEQSK